MLDGCDDVVFLYGLDLGLEETRGQAGILAQALEGAPLAGIAHEVSGRTEQSVLAGCTRLRAEDVPVLGSQ